MVDIGTLIRDHPGVPTFQQFPDSYRKALQKFWGGAYGASLDLLTKGLHADPNQDGHLYFYRLWLEILGHQGEHRALRKLANHLFLRGQEDAKHQPTYAALRGLIHLEIDEFEAAALLVKTVSGQNQDPYGLELEQRFAMRLSGGEEDELHLVKARTGLTDYFHWRTLAEGLLLANDHRCLENVLKFVQDHYPAAPMLSEFGLQKAIDRGDFQNAVNFAAKLCLLYPDNSEFNFLLGFSRFKLDHFEAASTSFARVVELTDHGDADAQTFLGECFYRLNDLQRAKNHFDEALLLKRQAGLPIDNIQMRLNSIDESTADDAVDVDDVPATRVWLVKLSARRYHELMTADENQIGTLVRPLGNAAQPGDLCFLAADSRGGHWRIAALYVVDSDPIWDPVDRYKSAMQLLARPRSAIPVDVHIMDDEADTQGLDKNHPYSFGVYELEMGALDIITEAIRQHNDLGHGADLMEHLHRVNRSS